MAAAAASIPAVRDSVNATVDVITKAVAKSCPDECPPCKTISGRIVSVGTLAYRPLDTPAPGKIEH